MSLDWGNYTILVAEDDPDLLDVMCEVLRGAGAKVLAAKNGKIAFEILQSQHVHFVLSDVQMPILNGLDLLKKIRVLNPKVPIVLLATGQAQVEEDEAIAMGAAGILRKPFSFQTLLDAVERVLLDPSAKQQVG